ncbi:MAG: SseB family protein [Myxococcales bacterium]|nr:SseB family protein [Myxococcales bacterium]
MDPTQRQELARHLACLVEDGGDHNQLYVTAGAYYVLITGRKGATAVELEAVDNAYLSRGDQLTEGRAAILRERGYLRSGKRPGVFRTAVASEPLERAALVEEIVDIFARAFGVRAPIALTLTLGDGDSVRNVELVRSMKLAARDRDMSTRTRLYRALAAAEFLVPVEREGDDAPKVVETLAGAPVFACFSDHRSLRRWEPRPCAYVHLEAAELFAATLELQLAALLINPRGDVGGQLYRHEVEMLDAAIRRLRARGQN